MFSIVHRNTSSYSLNGQNNKPLTMQFGRMRQPILNNTNAVANLKPKIAFAPSDGDKIKWGKPTWQFFHMLAHKIKPEYFKQVRIELLNAIYSICVTLPCPVCSEHAKQYMNSINFNNIQTKEDLKDMLFIFHNTVNVRKNYEPFKRENLDETYSKINTVAVAREFMFHYKDRQRSMKLLSDDLLRSKISVNIQNWFNNVYQFMEQ